jgi:hypothetical protein
LSPLVGTSGRWGEVKEKVKEGDYGAFFLVFVYENRKMKPVEIVLRRGKEGEGEQRKG